MDHQVLDQVGLFLKQYYPNPGLSSILKGLASTALGSTKSASPVDQSEKPLPSPVDQSDKPLLCAPVPGSSCAVAYDHSHCDGGWNLPIPQGEQKFKFLSSFNTYRWWELYFVMITKSTWPMSGTTSRRWEWGQAAHSRHSRTVTSMETRSSSELIVQIGEGSRSQSSC